jgi:hypothetical protein
MSQQRMALWAAEEEMDDDLQDVNPSLTIGNYGQNEHFDDGMHFQQSIADASDHSYPCRQLTWHNLRSTRPQFLPCSNIWLNRLLFRKSQM